MPSWIRSSLRYPKLVVRYCWDRAQALRRRLKARPKTRAEVLAERIEAAGPAEAKKLAENSWPGLQLPGPSPYISPKDDTPGSGVLALVVTEEALKFVATDVLIAGSGRARIWLVNGARTAEMKGRLEMTVTDARGTALAETHAALGEAVVLDFAPPQAPGLYLASFLAILESGARLQARGLITVAARPSP